MTSTFRLLLAAMPEIAAACEKINDPGLRDRAFDVLVEAARGGDTSYDRSMYAGTTYTGDPLASTAISGGYDPGATRVDNGLPRG